MRLACRLQLLTDLDPALIPINDLPLQKITSKGTTLAFLQFSPPEPSLAVPFLQLLALMDGHIYPSAEMHSTYTTASPLVARSKVFRQDQAVLPEEFADEVSWDLRRTMVRLQWECQSAVVGSGSEDSLAEGMSTWFEHPAGGLGDTTLDDGGGGSLKSCMRAAETASWADSFVARRIEIASDVCPPFILLRADRRAIDGGALSQRCRARGRTLMADSLDRSPRPGAQSARRVRSGGGDVRLAPRICDADEGKELASAGTDRV